MKEKVLLRATVSLLVKGDAVVLALKTRKIGEGCWNGYGGGINDAETVISSAIRELEEEAGVTALPEDLEKAAIIDFYNTKMDGTIFVCQVHFFIVKEWKGKPGETKDGAMITPTFFKKHDLPFEKMMPADRKFFPLILNGKKIMGKAKYSPFQKELLEEPFFEEVSSFPED
jgi:8-oxo-dGTP diphosphatase